MTMIGQSWQIGRIFGIPLKVHISWFVVFAWITYGLAETYFPFVQPKVSGARWEYWLMGIAAALLLFASVVVQFMRDTGLRERRAFIDRAAGQVVVLRRP